MFGLDVDAFGRVQGLNLRVPGEVERGLPKAKFVIYANRRSYAHPKGRSDLDAAYSHWQAKQNLLTAWRVHLERFAMPTVLGKYTRGLPAEEQSAILRALQDLANNTAIVYPSEIEIGTLGGDKVPSTGFQEAIDFHNREIARSILGQTLTTDEGRRVGSLALGKVHLQVLLLQVHALRTELADIVMTEQVIRPLVETNFGPGLLPRFEFEKPELDVFSTGKLV
jgi:phage gp29-like protein